MKKLMALLFVLTLSTSIMATEQNPRERWVCSGYGVINTGGPSGPITIPVYGDGATQLDAFNNAQQNCRNQGLQMCMINNCYKTGK